MKDKLKDNLIWSLEHLEPSIDTKEDSEIRMILPFIIKHQMLDVIVYGCGHNCYHTVSWLRLRSIEPIFIVDSDKNKCGKDFYGIQVIHVESLREKIRSKSVLAIITVDCWYDGHYPLIIEMLDSAGIGKVYHDFRQTDNWHDQFKPYLMEHKGEILNLYDTLADNDSRVVLREYIRAISDYDIYRLWSLPSWKKYFDDDIYQWSEDENIVDLGAYMGDTVYQIVMQKGNFGNIYAFESDRNRFTLLQNYIEPLATEMQGRIHLYNATVGDRGGASCDAILKDKAVSILKMDIEGAELQALKGAAGIISSQAPILAISAYHKAEDLVEIPNFIRKTGVAYTFYLRKYAHATALHSACEIILYAIPESRMRKK